MSPELMVMVVFVVVLILAFSLVVTAMAFKHEEKRLAAQAGAGVAGRVEQELAATQAEVARLRQRVQVLEKLATDGDRRLAGEIDSLRSEGRV